MKLFGDFSPHANTHRRRSKQRAQTKAIKSFIFSCFAVETLREEISFNIGFDFLTLRFFRPFAVCRFFFSEKTWIVSDYESYHMVKEFFFSLCCELTFFADRNNKVGDVGVYFTTSIASSLSRLIVRLIFHFMAVHDSLFALNCSCKRVRARVKRDRRISSDRDKTFLFTFMLPLADDDWMCLLLFQSLAPNFADGTGNCWIEPTVVLVSLPFLLRCSARKKNEVIENLLNIMCLSKSSIQMVNELTLMHAFLFAFSSLCVFFGRARLFLKAIGWICDNGEKKLEE